MADSAASGFAPAYPFGYQKNFVGSITATVLLVLLAAPGEFRLPARWLRVAGVLTAAGLLASQSRGAMVAFAVGVLIWQFRRPTRPSRVHRRAIVLLFAVTLVFVAALSVRDELQVQETTINSVTQRIEVAHATRQLWIDHPYTGVGLRFFKTPAYAELPAAERCRQRSPCRGRGSRASGLHRVRDRIAGRAQSAARRPRDCGLMRRRRAVRPRDVRHLLDRRHDRASLDRCWHGACIEHRATTIAALAVE